MMEGIQAAWPAEKTGKARVVWEVNPAFSSSIKAAKLTGLSLKAPIQTETRSEWTKTTAKEGGGIKQGTG